MEYNTTSHNEHERLERDEQYVQEVVGRAIGAAHEGTVRQNQALIDELGFEGISPRITNRFANDFLDFSVGIFKQPDAAPAEVAVAEEFALIATALGRQTQAEVTADGEEIPSGSKNLVEKLKDYQQLSRYDDPDAQATFAAASRVSELAFQRRLAPVGEVKAATVRTEHPKPADVKNMKKPTLGVIAAAAGALFATTVTAQAAAAAETPQTQTAPEKPSTVQNKTATPDNTIDLGTTAAKKAQPQKYDTTAQKSSDTQPAATQQPAKVTQETAPSPQSQPAQAAPTQSSSPKQQEAAPNQKAAAAPDTAPSQPAIPVTEPKADAPGAASPASPEKPSQTKKESAAAPEAKSDATAVNPAAAQTVTIPALPDHAPANHSERQDDAAVKRGHDDVSQPPALDVEHQVDLGALGKQPTPATEQGSGHTATSAAQINVPNAHEQQFTTAPVDLEDIKSEHPNAVAHEVDVPQQAAPATPDVPDLSTLAPNLKKVEGAQIYVPPLPEVPPAPAPEVPAQPTAPAPAEQAPATSEQQDFINAAQKLIEHGGEWAARGQAMKFFMEDPDLHFTPSQAAGFVGNLLGENGEMNPGKQQVGGPAFGIAQWEGGRLAALRQFGGDHYAAFDTQLQFIKHELLTSENATLRKLRQVTNDRKAVASLVTTSYERPSVPRIEERQAYADVVGDAFNTEYRKMTAERTATLAARTVVGTEIKTLFNQCDPAWGEARVGGIRTCDMGCGPTDVAMVVNALTGQNITPKDVYDYVTQSGQWLPGGRGTSFDAIIAAAKHWGVNGYQLSADKQQNADTYRAILSNGGLIVTAGSGPAQNKGASLPFVPVNEGAHYVIVRGMGQGGGLLVADSYPKTADTNTKEWDAGQLLSKVFGAVVFTKG